LITPARLPESAHTPHSLLKKFWGYDAFLPLQEASVQAILVGQDSLTILPTGGGKSLCYQLPALLMPGTTIVISPLVALMKDQVDTLLGLDISAAYLNSTLSASQQRETIDRFLQGEYRLLYVAPERLESTGFMDTLRQGNVAAFIVDEAHCISQWGHDFRPAYRALRKLKEGFPELGIHAYTATATPTVQDDICSALNLRKPNRMVGDFTRPNLLYRVQYRSDTLKQVCQVIDRHSNEAGIVYCISRKDVDQLSKSLQSKGYRVLPYHAGLSDQVRATNQAAFSNEQVDIIVATVAFGMGIDRSNVRYVIHTAIPKSIEHYQQEAGRAGRDRLPAECILLYSGADVVKWRDIMKQSETPGSEEIQKLALSKLFEMSNYCQRILCRHRFLVEYFGQPFLKASCGHCDCCLGEYEVMEGGEVIAQKILSCVFRTRQKFGAQHVAQVLQGADTEKIRQFQHQELSTYGLLSEYDRKNIVRWIEQLVHENFLEKEPEYGSLRLTPAGIQLLKEGGKVSLAQPIVQKASKASKRSKASTENTEGWSDEAQNLFEALRRLRRKIATEKRVPPYIIFSDVTLKEMVRLRPVNLSDFGELRGVGETKRQELGPRFIELIDGFQTGGSSL
jgi:ATP-dependent DNA helicase RecQ